MINTSLQALYQMTSIVSMVVLEFGQLRSMIYSSIAQKEIKEKNT